MASPDEHILMLLREKRLKVCLQTQRVWYFHSQNKRWYEKKVQYHPKSGRAKLLFDTPTSKRTTVYMHRLLWMAKHLEIPPEVVDHINENRHDDAIENLQGHTREESDRQGREIQRRRVVQNCIDFFWYLEFFGHEPPVGSPIDTGKGYR